MRQLLQKKIFSKRKDGEYSRFRFKELPNDLLPDDFIDIVRDEGHYSENESWDAYSELRVYRMFEETDEEYKKRVAETEQEKEKLKQKRRKLYFELKKEFEDEQD